MEMDTFEGAPVDASSNEANIILRKKTYGGVPPGAGMREDVIRLFEELEEARNALAKIQALQQEGPSPKNIKALTNGIGKFYTGKMQSTLVADPPFLTSKICLFHVWFHSFNILKNLSLKFFSMQKLRFDRKDRSVHPLFLLTVCSYERELPSIFSVDRLKNVFIDSMYSL